MATRSDDLRDRVRRAQGDPSRGTGVSGVLDEAFDAGAGSGNRILDEAFGVRGPDRGQPAPAPAPEPESQPDASFIPRGRIGILVGTPETGRPSERLGVERQKSRAELLELTSRQGVVEGTPEDTPGGPSTFSVEGPPRETRESRLQPDRSRPVFPAPKEDQLETLAPNALQRALANANLTLDRVLGGVRDVVTEGAEPGSTESRVTLALSRAIPDVVGEPAETAGLVFSGGVLPPDAGGREVSEKGIERAVEQGFNPNVIAALDLAGLINREAAIELAGLGPVRASVGVGRQVARGVRRAGAASAAEQFAVRAPFRTAFAEGAARFGPEGAALGALSQALEEGEINERTAAMAGIVAVFGGALGGGGRAGQLRDALASGDEARILQLIPTKRLQRVSRQIAEGAEIITTPEGVRVWRFPTGEEINVNSALADLATESRFDPITEPFALQTPEQVAQLSAAEQAARDAALRPPEVRPEVGPDAILSPAQQAAIDASRRPDVVRPDVGPQASLRARQETPADRGPRVADREVTINGETFNVVDSPGRDRVVINGSGEIVARLPGDKPTIVVAQRKSDTLLTAVERVMQDQASVIGNRRGAARVFEGVTGAGEGSTRAAGVTSRVATQTEFTGNPDVWIARADLAIPEEFVDDGLFHATTDLNNVRRKGLASRGQLKSDDGVLAGGTHNTVSVTYSRAKAETIADDLRITARAARGEATAEDVVRHFENKWGRDINDPDLMEGLTGTLRLGDDKVDRAFQDALDNSVDSTGIVDRALLADNFIDNILAIANESPRNTYRLARSLDQLGVSRNVGGEPRAIKQTTILSDVDGSFGRFRDMDPDNIGVVDVEARSSASGSILGGNAPRGSRGQAIHIPNEAELRFAPEDIQVVERFEEGGGIETTFGQPPRAIPDPRIEANLATQRGATGTARRTLDPETQAALDNVRQRAERLKDDRVVASIRGILPERLLDEFDAQVAEVRGEAQLDAQSARGRLRSEAGATRIFDDVTGAGEGSVRAARSTANTARTATEQNAADVRNLNRAERIKDGISRAIGGKKRAGELTPDEELAEALGGTVMSAIQEGLSGATQFAKLNFSRLENAVPAIFGENLGGQYATKMRAAIGRALPRKSRNFEDLKNVVAKHKLSRADREIIWDLVDEFGDEVDGDGVLLREKNAPTDRIRNAIEDHRPIFDRGLEDFIAMGGERNGRAAAGSGRFLPMIVNKDGIKLIRDAQNKGLGDGGVRATAEFMVQQGNAPDVDTALAMIKSFYDRNLHADLGYYTRERIRLPDPFIEKDYIRWAEDFFEREALFIEGINEFGVNGTQADAIIQRMRGVDEGAADLVENVHRMTFGSSNAEPLASTQIWGLVSNALTAAKLSSPFTTVRQVGQRFVNTVDLPISVQFNTLARDLPPVASRFMGSAASISEKAGLERVSRKLGERAQKIAELTDEAIRTGGVRARATATQDIIEGAPLEGVTDAVLRATGFLPGEAGNQIATSITAKRAVELLTHRIIRSENNPTGSRLAQYFEALGEGVIPLQAQGRQIPFGVPLLGGRRLPVADPTGAVRAKRVRTLERLAGGEGGADRLIQSRRALEDVGGEVRNLQPGQVTRSTLDRAQRLTDDPELQAQLVEAWRRGDSMSADDLSALAIRANEDRNFAMDVLTQPILWGQSGAFRTLFKFKPFMAKQFEFVRKAVFQEAVKGNLAPAAKIILAGGIIAEIWNVARDVFRDRQESITSKLLTDPSQLDSTEEWALQTLNHMADGAVVGIVTDLVWGWDNFAGGPLYSQLQQFGEGIEQVTKDQSLEQMLAAANETLQSSVPAAQLGADIVAQVEQGFSKDNFFPQYNRTRNRAREFAAQQRGESLVAGAIGDVIRGRGAREPTERSLRFQYAFDNVASGDLGAARNYLVSVLEQPETQEERETVRRSVEASLRSNAPLGPITNAIAWRQNDDVQALLREVGPEEAREIVLLQKRYLRTANRVLRDARREVRRSRREKRASGRR